jgi:hypothetical protein
MFKYHYKALNTIKLINNNVTKTISTNSSIITLLNNTINTSKFSYRNIILVKSQVGKSTVLIILKNNKLEDGITQVDYIVYNNLQVASSDII